MYIRFENFCSNKYCSLNEQTRIEFDRCCELKNVNVKFTWAGFKKLNLVRSI